MQDDDESDILKVRDPARRLALLEAAERARRKAARKAAREERAAAEFRAAFRRVFEFARAEGKVALA